jgi:hypothetical protein
VKEPKLPAKAEALLEEWPLEEPEWEAFATRIVERAKAEPAQDVAELLRAPLPAEPGEGGYEKTPEKVEGKASFSLAELARASVKKKSEGAKDIALESLQVASRERASVEEVVERVQAAKPQEKPPASTRDLATRVPPSNAWIEEHQGTPSLPQRVVHEPRPSRGPWIVSGFAALAAAAALILALKKSEPAQVTTVIQSPAATAAPTPAEHAPPSAPREPEAAPRQAEPLPPRAEEGQALAEAPRVTEGSPAKARRVVEAAPSASAAGVTPEAVVLEDEEPAPAPAPAAPAPPAASDKLRPAELPASGLPDKPSTGAVNAALGSVMGAARACVAGQEGPSTARVVFGSDGSVQSVAVSGAAAGTPAAACIEGAFRRARVQPFAAPSFSINTTVRPN